VVREAARRFGAAFRAERVDVAAGPNLEARLRAARYAVLPPDVLTGHTADDQAETVLLNLLRGTGSTGLAGMRAAGHPLLALRRTDTEALCASVGLQPVCDPSNSSPQHRRNRVRHELLPLLMSVAGRDVVPLLCRAAELARADDDLLDGLAAALDPTDALALAAAPLPLAHRALRRWLGPHLNGYPPSLADVTRVLAVARGERSACEISGGLRVGRSRQRLHVLRVAPARE
jgi:tRNA(Ile)-lysidine synthase